MRCRVRVLRYWKAENTSESCQDAAAYSEACGSFAVADGVGQASFSEIWAKALVEHGAHLPLLSADELELRWWLRRPQQEFASAAPPLSSLDPGARAKARDGSFSTVVLVRTTEIQKRTATLELQAVGDTCVFLLRPKWFAFPIADVRDFTASPNALTTKQWGHLPPILKRRIEVEVGSRLILATDAVASWILASGSGEHASPAEAAEALWKVDEADWPTFVAERREQNKLVDDDATAMLIEFADSRNMPELGLTEAYHAAIVRERQEEFDHAWAERDGIHAAVALGDPNVSGVAAPGAFPAEAAREAVNAFTRLLHFTRIYVDAPEKIVSHWRRWRHLLEEEPAAQKLLIALTQLGVERLATGGGGSTVALGVAQHLAPEERRAPEAPGSGDAARLDEERSRTPGREASRNENKQTNRAVTRGDLRPPTTLWDRAVRAVETVQPSRDRTETLCEQLAVAQLALLHDASTSSTSIHELARWITPEAALQLVPEAQRKKLAAVYDRLRAPNELSREAPSASGGRKRAPLLSSSRRRKFRKDR